MCIAKPHKENNRLDYVDAQTQPEMTRLDLDFYLLN